MKERNLPTIPQEVGEAGIQLIGAYDATLVLALVLPKWMVNFLNLNDCVSFFLGFLFPKLSLHKGQDMLSTGRSTLVVAILYASHILSAWVCDISN